MSSLYEWAFATGLSLIKAYENRYGSERAEKKMETLLLTLRSESNYDRFRRAVIDAFIEALPDAGIHEKLKSEEPWRVDEFYRYSTAILSGFFDALNKWRRDKKEEMSKQQQIQTERG